MKSETNNHFCSSNGVISQAVSMVRQRSGSGAENSAPHMLGRSYTNGWGNRDDVSTPAAGAAGADRIAGAPVCLHFFPAISHAIVARSLFKSLSERAREARAVLITNCAGDFFDTQIGASQEIRCSLQPFFG